MIRKKPLNILPFIFYALITSTVLSNDSKAPTEEELGTITSLHGILTQLKEAYFTYSDNRLDQNVPDYAKMSYNLFKLDKIASIYVRARFLHHEGVEKSLEDFSQNMKLAKTHFDEYYREVEGVVYNAHAVVSRLMLERSANNLKSVIQAIGDYKLEDMTPTSSSKASYDDLKDLSICFREWISGTE